MKALKLNPTNHDIYLDATFDSYSDHFPVVTYKLGAEQEDVANFVVDEIEAERIAKWFLALSKEIKLRIKRDKLKGEKVMKYLVILMCLVSVGCGNGKDGANGVNGTNGAPGVSDSSILSVWQNADPSSPIPYLDLTHLAFNVQMSASSVVDCPVPASGDASGTDAPQGFEQVTKGNLFVNGSPYYGIIQFGKQPHDSSRTGVCYIVGQEAYNYSVSGNSMTLCDITYGVCSVFNKQ